LRNNSAWYNELHMKNITVRLPADLRAGLNEIGARRKLPVSALVREAIGRYVSSERFRALREKIRPTAEAQGIHTDEDVFRVIS
jgi:predicted transcriptional regulator